MKILRIVLLAAAGAPFVQPPIVLSGRPFPLVTRFESKSPAPLRTLFVAAGKENGDGSEKHPWNDLEAALRALVPGDRLRVGAGEYPGSYEVDGTCRDGTREHPIEIRFDKKATIVADQAGGGVAIRKSHWRLEGLNVILGESPGSGLSIESPAGFVDVDGARIGGGAGPGVRIIGAAHVTISNTLVSKAKLKAPGDSSVGIEITGDASGTLLANNRLHFLPAGAIHVGPLPAGGGGPRDLEIRGNAIRDGGASAIRLEKAVGVQVLDNTIESSGATPESHGVDVEDVEKLVVRSNQFSNVTLGLMVGIGAARGHAVSAARDVTIDHNHFETTSPGGIAIDIEAGRDVRFVNNTVEGFASGILVLGRRPAVTGTVVANNLLLGVSDTAFVLADPQAASLFDFNVVSPAVYSVLAEVGSQKLALVHFLKGKAMPHTRIVPGVKILNRDLAIVSGVDTVDVGTPIANVRFLGLAPDIGAGEQ